uniref:Uncharacterized protein n=1 Tax=Arcella intermedia TaxID=1963864 RepID=A0A6B2LDC1_9EUKA
MENDTKKAPLVFYDIAFRPPVQETTCAVNPWKARYALNFKNADYSTTWVPMPDIPKVRKAVGAPPVRKFTDGTDFYTLPMLTDATTGTTLGDSFDIAIHLQTTYPAAGAGDLFPPQALDFVYAPSGPLLVPLSERTDPPPYAEYSRFNSVVDGLFTAHVVLALQGFPWDPATVEATKAEFMRRAGVSSWEQMSVPEEVRGTIMGSFQAALEGLAKLFQRDGSGPFLLGAQPSYGDCIVGAWLKMMQATLPNKEWEQLSSWHDGVFGRLHEALQKQFGQVK